MSRRRFLASLGVSVGAAAASGSNVAAGGEAATVEIRYAMNLPPPKSGPHTGTLDEAIQRLRPGPDLPLSFLHAGNDDLDAWRGRARAKMLELLHYDPAPCAPAAEVLERIDCGDYVREEIRFNTTPVFRVPATVLSPKSGPPRKPAVVALHSHGGFYLWGRERMIDEPQTHAAVQALRDAGYGGRAYTTELVRRGFVVIAIDMFYWGERRMVLADDPPEWRERPTGITVEQVTKFNQRSAAGEQLMGRTLLSAGVTWAGIIAWDDLRTVDYLCTRPDVDPRRIGCIGHSVGGLRSTYLAALDPRIRAAVVCGWMCSFPHQLARHVRSTIGHTKIIPGLYRHLDHPDIATIAAPAPLMVINGKHDALFEFAGVRAAHEKIARCYAKAGEADRFHGVIEDRPHEFNVARQAEAAAWFDRWL